MSDQELKWGILGPGRIARKFASDLVNVNGHKIIAAASRNKERSDQFARDFGVLRSYDRYESLLEDQNVDIVYIATPHTFHAEWAVKALDAGKHVLCEKPIGINEGEVHKIVEASKGNDRFLMEGLWSRFNPSIRAVLDHIRSGDIGEVNYVNADFTFYNNPSEEGRLLNMELAGGSLLDIGIYPLFLAYLIFGVPDDIKAIARYHDTGADVQMSAVLKYKNGLASASSSIASQSKMIAKIAGKEGAIYIDSRWHEADGYVLEKNGKEQHFSLPTLGNGFGPEIEECGRCIRSGRTESNLWSHQNSLDLIRIMDKIRYLIGLKYPFE